MWQGGAYEEKLLQPKKTKSPADTWVCEGYIAKNKELQ